MTEPSAETPVPQPPPKPNGTMPLARVQRKNSAPDPPLRQPPDPQDPDSIMTTEPSADMPNAPALETPGGSPSETVVVFVQRIGLKGSGTPEKLVPLFSWPT